MENENSRRQGKLHWTANNEKVLIELWGEKMEDLRGAPKNIHSDTDSCVSLPEPSSTDSIISEGPSARKKRKKNNSEDIVDEVQQCNEIGIRAAESIAVLAEEAVRRT